MKYYKKYYLLKLIKLIQNIRNTKNIKMMKEISDLMKQLKTDELLNISIPHNEYVISVTFQVDNIIIELNTFKKLH
jgi:hypothetical protein